MPDETSLTLLDRLRDDDQDAWTLMYSLYQPFLVHWLRSKRGQQDCDAEDIAHEVLALVQQKLHSFERERSHSFRCWLLKITNFCCLRQNRDRIKQQRVAPQGSSVVLDELNQLEDPSSDLEKEWKLAHTRYMTRHVLEKCKQDVEEETWKAFFAVKVEGKSAQEVASELGLQISQVYTAVARMKKRIRPELEKLLSD